MKKRFTFPVDGPPLMVLFDKGDKILKSLDFQKSPEEWIRQLRTASDVPDRADAAVALGNLRDNETAIDALGEAAQHDKFWGVREEALRSLGRINSPRSKKRCAFRAFQRRTAMGAAWSPSTSWAGSEATRKSPSACKTFTKTIRHIPCEARLCNRSPWIRRPTPRLSSKKR